MSWKPSLSPKQEKLVELVHRDEDVEKPKFILCSGPRFATKTIGCLHAIMEHAWNVNHAKVSCISLTVTAADDQGFWTELTTNVAKEWIDGSFGMKWVQEPKQKGTTKKLYFQVTNRFGTVSTVQLDSLEYEHEVEGRFKNKGYSMIYISELSNYKKRKTFDILIECLRGTKWKDNDFVFLGDTNPAEEGQNSWIYKLWYDFPTVEGLDEASAEFQKKLVRMEFSVADNIFMSESRKREQFARYLHNPDLMLRYHDGKWISASGDGIFVEHFKPAIHVLGDFETPANPNPDILLPEEGCFELLTGWDLGVSNSAFVIGEKVMRWEDKNRESSVFKILDEVVWLETDASMSQFVDECLEKMLWWEAICGRVVRWKNWSDRSAFDRKEPIANIYHHQLVYNLSNAKVQLESVDRTNGPVIQRVEITKKLLFENRLVVCRSKCPNVIESLQSLPPGRGTVAVDRTSRFKHVWDAMTYMLASECYFELMRPKNKDVNVGRAGSVVALEL